jgi:hypothetical protein
MKIYKDEERLDFEDIHTTRFDNALGKMKIVLNDLIEPDFNSISKLKGNKELLNLAFNAELAENT